MGINRQQALDCFASDDLIGIGMEADAVRRELHPEGVASYAVEGTLDPSLGIEAAQEAVAAQVAMEATSVALTRMSEQRIGLAQLQDQLRHLKIRFPQIAIAGVTATDIAAIGELAGVSLADVLGRLHDAGLETLDGSDANLLDEAPTSGTCSRQQWMDTHRIAHALGMRTAAAMRIGSSESSEQRVDFLEHLKRLQEETGGFCAFSLWTAGVSAGQTGVSQTADEPTAVEYLKTLAICRMFLDNIENVQCSWAAQGTKVLQMGLRFGTNDAGAVRKGQARAGAAREGAQEEELRRLIRDAGLMPVARDTLYNTVFLS